MATLVTETINRPPRAPGVAWEDTTHTTEKTSSSHTHEDGANEDACRTDLEHEEPLTPEQISFHWACQTRCFEGFEAKRMSYLNTTQLTCSNVMSTIVTARPIDTSTRRRGSGKVSNQSEAGSGAPTKPVATHVYAQPTNPKKVKKNGKYQAQLPSFQRSLPALPIPVHRLNQELIQERNKFMKQLHQEREDKNKLDNWAATKIQACYRGFRARPRVLTYETRQRLNSAASLRHDLTESLQRTATAHDDTSPGNEPDGGAGRRASVSSWRKEIQSRAGKKREFRARKDRMHSAVTQIQAVVKRLLARHAYARLLARHYDEMFLRAVIKIQGVFRGYRLRSTIMVTVAKLQSQAAIQIQSLVRGIQARERVSIARFERKCDELRRLGLPMQFTLPNRANEIVRVSCLRCLYEHRTPPWHLEFKTPSWREDRRYLSIYKVSIKLNVQRQWLLRMNIVVPTAKQRKKKPALARQASRLLQRSSNSNLGTIMNGGGGSTPTSPTTGRRRPNRPGPGFQAGSPTRLSSARIDHSIPS